MAADAPIFYFDFASPNAYFVHRVLPAIEARTGVAFRYEPVLLGGLFKLSGNQAPMLTFAGVPLKLAYQRLEIKRFIMKHGLTKFKMNPHFPVGSITLMRGAIVAERVGLLAPYVEAMFHYMWEEPRKLDDPLVIAQTLADAGLPAETFIQGVQDQAVKDRLAANTQAAHEHGVFGIPSFLVGKEMYFGKDSLRDVEELILSTAKAAS